MDGSGRGEPPLPPPLFARLSPINAMSTDSLFLVATRKKFRFASERGELTTEQLFDLPMTGKCSLNSIAIYINNELKGVTEESFVETDSNPAATTLRQKLEVVKEVIGIRQNENKERADREAKKENRRVLEDILQRKRLGEMENLPVEELERRLKEMG